MTSPMQPDAALLVKLGSLIVHAEEFFSPTGHSFDRDTFQSLIRDPDVQTWLKDMTAMAMLPLKRSAR